MKKLILIALVLGGMASATYAGVNVSVGIGVPLPSPVIVSRPPVFAAPHVVVAPPVYAPRVVAPYYPVYPRVYTGYSYYPGYRYYDYRGYDYRGYNGYRHDHRHDRGYCR